MAFRKVKYSREQAEDDFIRFAEASQLDFGYEIEQTEEGRVVKLENETDKISFESIVPLIEKCWLTVDENGNLTQKLQFPLVMNEDESRTITELKYKTRIANSLVLSELKNFKADDKDGRILANYAARTGRAVNTLKRLDPEDAGRAALITMICFLS